MLWFPSVRRTSEFARFHLLLPEAIAATFAATSDTCSTTTARSVVYAVLPGAQHAWDIFRSARAMESVQAVTPVPRVGASRRFAPRLTPRPKPP